MTILLTALRLLQSRAAVARSRKALQLAPSRSRQVEDSRGSGVC